MNQPTAPPHPSEVLEPSETLVITVTDEEGGLPFKTQIKLDPAFQIAHEGRLPNVRLEQVSLRHAQGQNHRYYVNGFE